MSHVRISHLGLALGLTSLAVTGCGPSRTVSSDAGTPPPRVDAGTRFDAGTPMTDAGSGPADAGATTDAGSAMADADSPDAGSVDAGGALDAGSADGGAPSGVCPDDDLGMAEGLAIAMGTTAGGTDDFTPDCVTRTAAEDVAFTWTAPRTGDFIVTTNGSDSTFDTIVAVLDGASCTATTLACDDDDGDGLRSSVLVSVTGGNTYVVVIDGYDDDKGNFLLSIYEGSDSEADLCADGIDNDGDGDTDCEDTECSASDDCTESGEAECSDMIDNDGDDRTDCDDSACATTLACTETGVECLDTIDNDDDGLTDCDDDDCVGDEACIETGAECSDSDDNDGDGLTDCDDDDCARFSACDRCPGTELGSSVGSSVGTGNNVSAVDTRSPPSDCVISVNEGRELTYRWTAPTTGSYRLDTNGSSYDTVLYILDGGCSGETVVCDDDSGDGLDSDLTLSASAGQTYIIVIDGYSEFSEGDHVLNITAL